MKYANRKFAWMLSFLSLVLVTGGTALADDTELFIADGNAIANSEEARPNILFIIDTSGSMGSTVKTQSPWDADETYTGCYDNDRVYWRTSAGTPDCDTSRYFDKKFNLCYASVGALDAIGEYKGELLAWRYNSKNSKKSRWVELNSSAQNRFVECKADAGTHGSTSGVFYASDGQTGPHNTLNTNQPAWVSTYYLYDGNYLNWLNGDGVVEQSRLEVVQDVTNNLLKNLNGVNVGLMRFNNDDGGPVIFAMEHIETARAGATAAVNSLTDDGWTPLSETLFESYRYFSGGSVLYGDGHQYSSVAGSRVGNTLSSKTYNSPIDFGCQKNYIIMLTDGEPTEDTGVNDDIPALPDFNNLVGSACSRVTGTNDNQALCMDELAEYMQKRDLNPNVYGLQNVTTYTIGFTIDLPLLAETAKKGGGKYYLADETASLSSALTKIVVSILDDASTFAAPAVPVNSFNRTQSLNDIFVSVFNPSSTVHWPGNVKKYALVGGNLLDANKRLAVDNSTGFFRNTSQSFWSDEVDGDRSADGGAAAELPAFDARNVYTNINGGDLNAAGNRISLANTDLTPAILAVPDNGNWQSYTSVNDVIADINIDNEALTPIRAKLLAWMLGLDIFDDNDNGNYTDTRRQMGDPLHVRPVPVIYGGTAAQPDMTVYIATNDGYLHAIDPDTGAELWSWVPARLLPMMYSKYLDDTSVNRVYGIDGEITAHVVNDDGRGGISGSERVILVFGMRRGGDGVFALDVTDRNDPQLLWEVNQNTTGFEDIGQSWSTPQIARVNVGGTKMDVALLGGGYDPGQDYDNYRTDARGNAVYMINLLTGELVWSAGPDNTYDLVLPAMEHSIPAPLRVIDMNSDGLADRLYVGDMGGRVWRFDLFNGKSVDRFGQGGVIASLGGAAEISPTLADLRRFYNQVDVVDYSQDGRRFLALNIGSGYRAHPLDRVIDEEFYSVRDFNPVTKLANGDYGSPIVRGDLVDITGSTGAALQKTDAGWRLSMDAAQGEKVLGRSITFAGVVYFTSFSPDAAANACSAFRSTNRLYKIALGNGDPVVNLDGSVDPDNLTASDRSSIMPQGGIASQVEIIHTADDPTKTTILSSTYTEQDPSPNLPIRTFWTQEGSQ